MIAKLLYADGTLKEKVVLLNKFPFLIGRHSEADLRIDHPLMSRRHCEITEENGVLIVRDLGSRNGILVNDVSVKESALKQGDSLSIGLLTFRVAYHGDSRISGILRRILAPLTGTRKAEPETTTFHLQ
jgi:pSer/pThr/pTyr-binding forkhead associated (FHA) protein